jgi:hypothetical protein
MLNLFKNNASKIMPYDCRYFLLGSIITALGYFFFMLIKDFSASILLLKLPTQTL